VIVLGTADLRWKGQECRRPAREQERTMSEPKLREGTASAQAPQSGAEERSDERFDEPARATVALARQAATGDSVATGKLLGALAPRLGRVVRAILGADHADLDDALQHALIGLVQALPAYRGDCDPVGYATVIAVRAALAVRKRTRTDRSRRDDDADADALPEANPSPGEVAAAARRKAILRDLLAELAQEQAEALAMRVVLGWSLEEIAQHSGAPLNTVRSRLRLAKEGLKRRIEADPSLVEALEVER
jgi:RNA polymerase sigma-70 factor (ECF subfamily)